MTRVQEARAAVEAAAADQRFASAAGTDGERASAAGRLADAEAEFKAAVRSEFVGGRSLADRDSVTEWGRDTMACLARGDAFARG